MASGEGYGRRTGKNKCEICGRTFDDEYALSYHKSVEHGPDKRSATGVT